MAFSKWLWPGAIDRTDAMRERWPRHADALVRWAEGSVGSGATQSRLPLQYRIIRSFDSRWLYTRPARFIERRFEVDDLRLEWVESGETRLPIHLDMQDAGEFLKIVAYLFVYDSRPVAHPFRDQFARIPRLLLRGSQPLTLFLVAGSFPRAQLPEGEAHAVDWLTTAWRRYHAMCPGPAS
jgi:hypothetical protein